MKRLHQSVGGGFFRQLPYVVDCNGNTKAYPVTSTGLISATEIQKKGLPVLGANSKPVNQSKMTPQNVNLFGGYAIQEAELPYGQGMNLREETPGIQQTRRLLQVTIDNTEATTETIILFDGHNFAKTKLGVAAPKAGVLISGTFLANTYAWLQSVTKCNPYRVAGLQIQGYTSAGAKSDGFFNNGSYTSLDADEGYQTIQQVEFPMSDLVYQDSFNTNIRTDKGYRAIFDGFSGAQLVVPNGQKVVINYTLISVARGYAMKRIGVKGSC